MTPFAALLILAGVAVGGGILMVLLWFSPSENPVGPSRRRARVKLSTATRNRLVVGLILGFVLAVAFSFPLLVVALPVAFVGLPLLLSRQDTTSRDLTLALAAWARSLAATAETGNFTLREVIEVSQGSTPPLLRAGVDRMCLRMNASWSVADALHAFADEIDSAEADEILLYLIQASAFQSEGLAEALRGVADALAGQAVLRIETYNEREKPRRTMRTMTIIVGVVLALLVAFSATPQLATYKTPFGAVILVVLLTLYAVILLWARSLTKVPPEPRILKTRATQREEVAR